MEGPAYGRVEALGCRLAYVVQQRGPAQPKRRVLAIRLSYIVQDHERMREILLVPASLDRLHPLQGAEFGQDMLQQPGLLHQLEGH